MKLVYQCENCKATFPLKSFIFHCGCGKEICEDCMYSWATCEECAKKMMLIHGKDETNKILKAQFDKNLN